ncbi:MAG TPA: F0F1 ATP synthase subunit A [Micromonosporaceae bacterium]
MVSGQVSLLADARPPFPPGVGDFFLPGIAGAYPWLTKFTLMVWFAVALIILFFLVSYRKPQLVPTKSQWLAESMYGFIRDGVAKEVIGARDGLRFAPYLASLFLFLLVTNVFGIIPFLQISPNAHIAFPATLAILSYILYLAVGVRKHGLVGYFKLAAIPPAPGYLLPLLIPIELVQNFITRPVTLALRLFANMFAGHLLLLVFTLGGFVLATSSSGLIKTFSPFSFLMAIVITLFELFVAALQAYVFTILTASYVESSLAESH